MDSLIKIIEAEHKNLQKKKDTSNNESGDSLYLIHPISLSANNNEINGNDTSALNFSNLPVNKMVHVINSTNSLKEAYFANSLYKSLSEDDFREVLKQVTIPCVYLKKMINYCFSMKKGKDKTLRVLLDKNIEAITEDIVLKIIKSSPSEDILQIILEKVPIDVDFMMQLLKEDDTNCLEEKEIKLICDSIVKTKKVEFGWIDFAHDILVMSYLKKLIKEEYYSQILNEIGLLREKENKKEEDKEEKYENEFDFDLINKISNNSSKIIVEKLII